MNNDDLETNSPNSREKTSALNSRRGQPDRPIERVKELLKKSLMAEGGTENIAKNSEHNSHYECEKSESIKEVQKKLTELLETEDGVNYVLGLFRKIYTAVTAYKADLTDLDGNSIIGDPAESTLEIEEVFHETVPPEMLVLARDLADPDSAARIATQLKSTNLPEPMERHEEAPEKQTEQREDVTTMEGLREWAKRRFGDVITVNAREASTRPGVFNVKKTGIPVIFESYNQPKSISLDPESISLIDDDEARRNKQLADIVSNFVNGKTILPVFLAELKKLGVSQQIA